MNNIQITQLETKTIKNDLKQIKKGSLFYALKFQNLFVF